MTYSTFQKLLDELDEFNRKRHQFYHLHKILINTTLDVYDNCCYCYLKSTFPSSGRVLENYGFEEVWLSRGLKDHGASFNNLPNCK